MGLTLLQILLLWILIFSIIPLITKGNEYRFGFVKIRFVFGGFLIYLGKGVNAYREKKRLGKAVKIGFVSSTFIGMAMFYILFLPHVINMV